MDIKVLPDLKNLIPPLTPDEFAQLEANCIQYGIQDKLKVWCSGFYCTGCGNEISFSKEEIKRAWYDAHSICEKDLLPSHEAELFTLGKGCDDCGDVRAVNDGIDANIVLLDGHNRYAIAQKNNLPFEVEYLDFANLEDAEVWMIKNQFGRRNLPNFVKGELALELEKRLRPKAKENLSVGGKITKPFHNCEKALIDPINVTKEVAAVAGVSHNTIARIKKIKNNADEKTIEKLRNQEISINKAYGVVRKNEQREKRKEQAEKAKQIEIKKTLVDFRFGDFVDVFSDITDGSIDLILTDPPYPYEFIEQWSRLSSFAARVLKPGGFCIAYSGHLHLPEVMQRMAEHLDWYWMLSLNHAGFGEHFFSRMAIIPR